MCVAAANQPKEGVSGAGVAVALLDPSLDVFGRQPERIFAVQLGGYHTGVGAVVGKRFRRFETLLNFAVGSRLCVVDVNFGEIADRGRGADSNSTPAQKYRPIDVFHELKLNVSEVPPLGDADVQHLSTSLEQVLKMFAGRVVG